MQMQFLRRLSQFTSSRKLGRKASWEYLTWILREELGESTDRIHWHALIGGLPFGVTTQKTCMFMMGFWEGMGGGMSRIRVFEAGQGAAEYISKGLEGNATGANRYEVGKFSFKIGRHVREETLMLIPSRSLLAKWRALAAKDGGRHLAQAQAQLPPVTTDRTADWPVGCAAIS